MSSAQEHAAAAASISTGIMTFFHILPEVLGCILSLCGIIWYVIQIRYAYLERRDKVAHLHHRASDPK